MPSAPQRRCQGSPLCPSMQGQCAQHPQVAWRRGPAPPRIRGRALCRLRESLFIRHHYKCASCGQQGSINTLVRDHIINLAQGGEDTEANTQPLCIQCHENKTQAEAQRGR